jgi:acyl-CoA-binding protein
MSELDAEFQQASEDVKQLTKDPGNDAKLKLYGLYKQGTEGDVSGKRPGRLDMVGRAKYDAWEKEKGQSLNDAKRKYVEFVASLKG